MNSAGALPASNAPDAIARAASADLARALRADRADLSRMAREAPAAEAFLAGAVSAFGPPLPVSDAILVAIEAHAANALLSIPSPVVRNRPAPKPSS